MSRITVEQAIKDIRDGKMVILVDDEDRENEGDLTMAAEKATPEAINFMAKYGRGLICLSMTSQQCDQLELPLMVKNNTSPFQTGFTISIEAAKVSQPVFPPRIEPPPSSRRSPMAPKPPIW
jgi:3,4-dihydroxy 2-butanone 4-phosphate synthase / GTP cyclohydrolase II